MAVTADLRHETILHLLENPTRPLGSELTQQLPELVPGWRVDPVIRNYAGNVVLNATTRSDLYEPIRRGDSSHDPYGVQEFLQSNVAYTQLGSSTMLLARRVSSGGKTYAARYTLHLRTQPPSDIEPISYDITQGMLATAMQVDDAVTYANHLMMEYGTLHPQD